MVSNINVGSMLERSPEFTPAAGLSNAKIGILAWTCDALALEGLGCSTTSGKALYRIDDRLDDIYTKDAISQQLGEDSMVVNLFEDWMDNYLRALDEESSQFKLESKARPKFRIAKLPLSLAIFGGLGNTNVLQCASCIAPGIIPELETVVDEISGAYAALMKSSSKTESYVGRTPVVGEYTRGSNCGMGTTINATSKLSDVNFVLHRDVGSTSINAALRATGNAVQDLIDRISSKAASLEALITECSGCTEGLVVALDSWFDTPEGNDMQMFFATQAFNRADVPKPGKRYVDTKIHDGHYEYNEVDSSLYRSQRLVHAVPATFNAHLWSVMKCVKLCHQQLWGYGYAEDPHRCIPDEDIVGIYTDKKGFDLTAEDRMLMIVFIIYVRSGIIADKFTAATYLLSLRSPMIMFINNGPMTTEHIILMQRDGTIPSGWILTTGAGTTAHLVAYALGGFGPEMWGRTSDTVKPHAARLAVLGDDTMAFFPSDNALQQASAILEASDSVGFETEMEPGAVYLQRNYASRFIWDGAIVDPSDRLQPPRCIVLRRLIRLLLPERARHNDKNWLFAYCALLTDSLSNSEFLQTEGNLWELLTTLSDVTPLDEAFRQAALSGKLAAFTSQNGDYIASLVISPNNMDARTLLDALEYSTSYASFEGLHEQLTILGERHSISTCFQSVISTLRPLLTLDGADDNLKIQLIINRFFR